MMRGPAGERRRGCYGRAPTSDTDEVAPRWTWLRRRPRRQYVQEVIDELTERRELIELREGRDRARALVKARVDVSAEGVKRSRYEAMSDRAHHAALRELRGLQEMRRRSGEVGTEGSGSQE